MRLLLLATFVSAPTAVFAERIELPNPPINDEPIRVETTEINLDVRSIICVVQYIRREDGGSTKLRRCIQE